MRKRENKYQRIVDMIRVEEQQADNSYLKRRKDIIRENKGE